MTKDAARKAAMARRAKSHGSGADAAAQARLAEAIAPFAGRILAGYMPMRGEISPLPIMAAHCANGPVCVPVITAHATPLAFHRWTPDITMVPGTFGALVPATAEPVIPDVLIVPLVAFDRAGNRLGYGGGFYDRTLEALRAIRPTIAIGFAYAAQETDALPQEPTDQPLNMIVTERETLRF